MKTATYAALLHATQELRRAERALRRAQVALSRAEASCSSSFSNRWDEETRLCFVDDRLDQAKARRERAELRIEVLCQELEVTPLSLS